MEYVENLIDQIIDAEGGYVNHPDDTGGETNWGITKAVAIENGYTGDMKDMDKDIARSIYRNIYWIKPQFDKVAEYSEELAAEMFDTGVNMGVRVPVMFLQRWLNGFNYKGKHYADVDVDGVIGPATLAALEAFLQKRGRQGEAVIVKAMNCSQGAAYLSMTEHVEAKESFLYGWMANRVEL